MKAKLVNFILIISLLCGIGIWMTVSADDDITVYVNNQAVQFDQKPIIENDRTLVPVRAIFEALDAEVSWNQEKQLVSAVKGSDSVSLQIGSKLMKQNQKLIVLDVAPRILNDRTLVPLRAVSESFSAYVEWQEENRTVVITTEEQQTPPSGGVTTPTPTPKPESTPEADASSSFEQQVFQLVNQERAKQGLSPLTWNEDLANVARAHSKDMNDRKFMDHTNPDGLSPFDRMKNYGIKYTRAAENIAAGQTTPQAVMNGWMNSSGHRANILNPNLTQIGVGYYKGNGPYKTYWTQCFIA